ncbi:hypothetical protein QR680_008778 [Steinernema hermaphroditum]|uniref:Uncharacterized protein n=1 Tax=Steinernema hermaphroditum TaxID=289476 RepID=A0AA39IJB3_9BILA|nr:hypothetical protein QR680_008778 [Steinernema hermaphroditum]
MNRRNLLPNPHSLLEILHTDNVEGTSNNGSPVPRREVPPFNCAKYLELGHHGEHVLLEKTCPPDRQFNPLSCKCEENFNCETCTHAQMMGNAGDRHYRLHLDMEKPHQIRCPEGEHYCEQSRHCVSDDF